MIGIGGVGASAQVQNNMASENLGNFDVPLSISLTTKAQDWATRQKIQYAAVEGLISKDFLSLQDWSDQIRRYSLANPVQLNGPYGAIASSTSRNQMFKATQITEDRDLGLAVGLYLEQLPNFADVFVAEQSLVTDSEGLASALGVS
jgi:hypothetical protein